MTLVVFLASLVGSMAIGLPICFSLLFSGVCMMLFMNGFNSQILSQNLFSGADSFSMMAVPFFILAGEFMNRGGITKRIVNAANAMVGHVRGGLGYVSILAILLFASMVGSAVASTAALGAILIPMMVRAGYNRDKSTGLIAAGNILSPIMPPSVPMIIFGVQASVSVTSLFMAGIAPAVYLSASLCILWFFVAKKDKLPTAPRQSRRQVVKSLTDGFWALLLPVFILVGLRSGKFTPTEAGVITAVYALIIGLFVYRELKLSMLMDCLVSAAKSSSVIMFLAAAAMVSSWLMTVGNIPSIVTGILAPFIAHPTLLMLVIAGIVLLVGTSMDVTPTIMILTPVLLPAVRAAGIDVVYFGVVFILNTVMGLLTPPV
ncbi:MAG: TRAP transporter large permease subunit, partial [Enterocloster clostridioformis]|nr:TRAP transporter large permease subunit [Enterocloster clostridioformis]